MLMGVLLPVLFVFLAVVVFGPALASVGILPHWPLILAVVWALVIWTMWLGRLGRR